MVERWHHPLPVLYDSLSKLYHSFLYLRFFVLLLLFKLESENRVVGDSNLNEDGTLGGIQSGPWLLDPQSGDLNRSIASISQNLFVGQNKKKRIYI